MNPKPQTGPWVRGSVSPSASDGGHQLERKEPPSFFIERLLGVWSGSGSTASVEPDGRRKLEDHDPKPRPTTFRTTPGTTTSSASSPATSCSYIECLEFGEDEKELPGPGSQSPGRSAPLTTHSTAPLTPVPRTTVQLPPSCGEDFRDFRTYSSANAIASWLYQKQQHHQQHSTSRTIREWQLRQLDLDAVPKEAPYGGALYGSKITTKRYRKQNRDRKPRQAYTAVQLERLEEEFKKDIYVSISKRSELSRCLNLTDTQVKTWFQNRRTKFKKQTHSRSKMLERTMHHARMQHADSMRRWLLQPPFGGGGPGPGGGGPGGDGSFQVVPTGMIYIPRTGHSHASLTTLVPPRLPPARYMALAGSYYSGSTQHPPQRALPTLLIGASVVAAAAAAATTANQSHLTAPETPEVSPSPDTTH
ncbi:homeobox protein php-3 [Anopheles bellator]|uniref:homeobox protein php-3 n=1 Tax=Anopheles bellator TaxID=139047 RepID=UPI00264A4E08|nr:homeobox protein php-3 [Anopheles bellator]